MTTLRMDADTLWRVFRKDYIDKYTEWLVAQGCDPDVVASVEHGEGVIITKEFIPRDGGGFVIEWPSGDLRTHRVTRPVGSLPPLPTPEDYR